MDKAKTRCKVCLSRQKDYIEEMIKDKVPLKIISGRMWDVYKERISADAVARHRDNHMAQPHSNNDRVQESEKMDKTHSDKTHSDKMTEVVTEEVVSEEPLSEIDALKKRVLGLEIISWRYASTVAYTQFNSYSLAGTARHQITYRNLVEESMDNIENLEASYNAIVARVKNKMITDGNLCLSDADFEGPREEKRKKERDENKEKMNAAELAVSRGKEEIRQARDMLDQLK